MMHKEGGHMDELFMLTLRRAWLAIEWFDPANIRDHPIYPNTYIVRRIPNPIMRFQSDPWFQFREHGIWISIGAAEAFWRNWEDGIETHQITIKKFRPAFIVVPVRLV